MGLSFAKTLLLNENENLTVEIWDKDPHKCSAPKTLKETLKGADFVFLCIPSWGLKEFLKKSVALVGHDSVIVPFAKGLFAPKPFAGYLKKIKQPWVVVSGPMLAEEMGDGLSAFGLAAASGKKIFSEFQKLFEGSKIQFEYSSDAYGVSLIGVIKNIYATWLGVADGLNLGGNFKGLMAGKAILEMIKLEEALKIKKETIFNANNFGDLIATGFSSGSCNRRFGEALAKNQKPDFKCEGASSLPFLIKILGEKKAKKFPLLWSLNRAILSNKK